MVYNWQIRSREVKNNEELVGYKSAVVGTVLCHMISTQIIKVLQRRMVPGRNHVVKEEDIPVLLSHLEEIRFGIRLGSQETI